MTKTIIIDGKETHYTISDKGEVFNEKTGKVLKGTYARNEYHTVQLTIDGKPKTFYDTQTCSRNVFTKSR